MNGFPLARRSILAGASGALGLLLCERSELGAAQPPPSVVHDAFPSQDPAVVRDVVSASHARIDRVRELVVGRPELANAAWDWGFGDWETALGAASHTGRREIAELLIAHGARQDIFSAAMLGSLQVVRGLIEAQPGIQRRLGPHGITLLSHARAGGEPAAAVIAFLEALGDADTGYVTVELDPQTAASLIGDYRFGPGDLDRLIVAESPYGGLSLERVGGVARTLFHQGALEFHPAGAPSVCVRLRAAGEGNARLEIGAPRPILEAIRVA